MKCLKGFVISNGYIPGPAGVSQVGVLGTNTRIIQTRRDGMGRRHLTILIL